MSQQTNQKEESVSIEGKHVVYCAPPDNRGDDLHVIKEWVTDAEGNRTPRLSFKYNFKRPYYLTKEGFRNHEQKKEWEDLHKLDRYMTREYELVPNAANSLKLYNLPRNKRDLAMNPYVYGIDISSSSIIKQLYLDGQEKKGVQVKLCTVAGLDSETDMVRGDGKIIMLGVTYKDRAYTAVVKSFVEGLVNIEEDLQALARKYIPEVMDKRQIKWEIEIVDTPADTVIQCFKRLHEWKPDWVSVWNLDFDYHKMKEALEDGNIDIAQVFSDPSVPDRFKFFHWHQGSMVKKTEDGKETPIPPQQRWDVATFPATFRLVDSMQAYDKVRTGSALQTSYKLDHICDISKVGYDKETKKIYKKLRFPEDSHLVESSPEWHEFMQRNFKLRYILYNLFDNILLEMLDETTKDLADTVDTFAQSTDLINFRSQPRRKVDECHFEFIRDYKLVMGSTARDMSTPFDKRIYDLRNWIITLAAHLNSRPGLKIVENAINLYTNIYILVYDLDVSSSYPNGIAVMNMSKMTTVAEIIGIEGEDDEFILRYQGMNLSSGHVNAIEFCSTVFGLPTAAEFSEIYRREHGTPKEPVEQ